MRMYTPRYYRRDGTPCSMEEWAAGYENFDERKRVALDVIGGTKVSTVWLGLDHSFGSGPPLIFETMVFGGEFDQEQQRYSTEEEAKAGHARWVERVKADKAPPT